MYEERDIIGLFVIDSNAGYWLLAVSCFSNIDYYRKQPGGFARSRGQASKTYPIFNNKNVLIKTW